MFAGAGFYRQCWEHLVWAPALARLLVPSLTSASREGARFSLEEARSSLQCGAGITLYVKNGARAHWVTCGHVAQESHRMLKMERGHITPIWSTCGHAARASHCTLKMERGHITLIWPTCGHVARASHCTLKVERGHIGLLAGMWRGHRTAR